MLVTSATPRLTIAAAATAAAVIEGHSSAPAWFNPGWGFFPFRGPSSVSTSVTLATVSSASTTQITSSIAVPTSASASATVSQGGKGRPWEKSLFAETGDSLLVLQML